MQNGNIKMENKELGPFKVETAKLAVKGLKLGTFTFNPQAIYVDDLGKTKTFDLQPVTVTVNPRAPRERVAGKISSGTPKLDHLLLGGLPENYAIALSAPSSDERETLVDRFLKAGVEAGEITFHITVDPGNTKTLAEKHQSNFYVLLCSPLADSMLANLPNVYKLKGVENLTEIDIALTKAFRTLDPSAISPRRICLNVISDVLLQHHVVNTRRWLSTLLPTLKSKGFTVLAVIDPAIHPSEETQAVLGLFEGEISIHDKETTKGISRFLKIRKMTGQKYLKNETSLEE